MKNHTRVFLASRGLTTTDFIPCEVCGTEAVDIHHIDARGMGGAKNRDTPENLVAVCRNCHVQFGDKKQHKAWLRSIVIEKLNGSN